MHDLLRRQRALEKTRTKFRGKPLDFCSADCIRMFRSHLVAMGHRGLPPIPRYSTPVGAKRALRGMGFETLEQLLDSLLPRISPAEMLPGDVALMPGDEMFDAVTICVGYKFFGWHGASEKDEPVDIGSGTVSILSQIKAAYRV